MSLPRHSSRIRDSEKDRFQRLCWPALPSLMRTARFLTWNDADAEDLVQETMLKAFKSMASLEDERHPRAWLMTIMRHLQIDRIRAQNRRIACVPLEDPGLLSDRGKRWTDDTIDRWSDPEKLLDGFHDDDVIVALRALPEPIRWTLLLVDVEGLDHQHAADVLEVPMGTIKSRAHRGRRMLYGALIGSKRESGRSVVVKQ